MSHKHNVAKRGLRSRSHYRARLATRGLTKAPQMEPVETLRDRQLKRLARTGTPFPATNQEAP